MTKSRGNAKKLFFSGIFGRKKCFSKIGLHNILGIAILHHFAKFHEKIITAREIQEIPFSGENRLFRRFLESSGYKNQFY